MKPTHRRHFLHLAASAAALQAVSRLAWAQAYPTRPVRWVVPTAPGGASDIVARLMSQSLSERLGRPFVVDNRPGAATNIGTEAVVKAVPDGYTLLFVTSINAANAALYDNLNFNFIRDIAPVASIDRLPLVMEVNPSVPAKTVREFIAYARVNPGKINSSVVVVRERPQSAATNAAASFDASTGRPEERRACDLKMSAGAVDDESRHDNEKHNCGGDRPPVIFALPGVGPPAVVVATRTTAIFEVWVYHFRARASYR